MKITCEFCGDPLDPKSKNTYQALTGWIKPRPQGGVNSVALREMLPRFAHAGCVAAEKSVGRDQGSLL